MVAITRLSIESLPTAGNPDRIQYPCPNPTSSPKEVREEPPFSHLWKGICDFFTSIFKRPGESSWKQKTRIPEEENKSLRARLAEKEKDLERMERVTRQKIELGAKRIHEVLVALAENTHMKCMGELQGLAVLFQRHEVVVVEYLRYKQGYETLAEKYNALKEQNRFLIQQNEELAALKIEFENLFMRERDKVFRYERAWYGIGDGSSSS